MIAGTAGPTSAKGFRYHPEHVLRVKLGWEPGSCKDCGSTAQGFFYWYNKLMTTYLAATQDLEALAGAEPGDPLVALALRRASGRFIEAIGYDPSYRAGAVFTLSAYTREVLFLPVAPIETVHEIFNIRANEVVDPSLYAFDSETGAVFCLDPDVQYWPTGFSALRVTADVGFRKIPDGIQDAVLEQAMLLYSAPDVSVQQISQGSRSVSFMTRTTAGVTQKWTDAVALYRRGSVDAG